MDPNEYIAILTGVAGVTGGFFGGKRLGSNQTVSMAVNVTELLQAQVEILKRKGETDATEIADLRGRVGVLESLVTQRAEVEAVHDEVQGVRGVVDRIASKVGA